MTRLLGTAVAAAMLLGAAPAGAVEVVQDGGFEAATTCAGAQCDSPNWTEARNYTAGGQTFGPICNPNQATGCNLVGTGPRNGTRWLWFGEHFTNVPFADT